MTRPVRVIALVVAAVSMAVLSTATLAAPAAHKHSHKAAAAENLSPDQKRVTVYRCAKGDCERNARGVCPTHKTKLVRASIVRTWKCESCGMTFNHAGMCSMDNTPLTAYDVSFTCPADGKPVEKGGMCTRCDMDAKATLVKAPVAETAKK